MKKLDAFTFSILTNCENGFVGIDQIIRKLTDRITREDFVQKRIKELCADGSLEREGNISITCTKMGRKLIKDTRKARKRRGV